MRRAGSLNLSWIGFRRLGAPMISGKGRAAAAIFNSRRVQLPLLLLGGILLSACSPAQASSQLVPPSRAAAENPQAQVTESSVQKDSQAQATESLVQKDSQGPAPESLVRTDSQGAVQVDVFPVDLTGSDDETLTFDVSMNTHSVDLSMDLAAFSTLQTDTGVTLAALDWSGGSGHHVSGTLRFPAIAPDARPALEGASRLTLTIRDLDASERVFEWSLPPAQ